MADKSSKVSITPEPGWESVDSVATVSPHNQGLTDATNALKSALDEYLSIATAPLPENTHDALVVKRDAQFQQESIISNLVSRYTNASKVQKFNSERGSLVGRTEAESFADDTFDIRNLTAESQSKALITYLALPGSAEHYIKQAPLYIHGGDPEGSAIYISASMVDPDTKKYGEDFDYPRFVDTAHSGGGSTRGCTSGLCGCRL